MKDNLPEVDIRGRKDINANKEKRGGFLGWLRGLGGGATQGAIGGAGSSSAGAGGLGALLAGNLSTVAAVIISVGFGGAYLVSSFSSSAPVNSSEASNYGQQTQEEYVPAILRSEAANKGSSLAMLADTNKGSGLSLEMAPPAAKKTAPAPEEGKGADSAAVEEPVVPNAQDVVAGAMAGLNGGGAGSLTTALGSGGGRFAGMGNKFGGNMGQSFATAGNVGRGFAAMPGFQERKAKLLAMRAGARPALSGGGKKTSKYTNYGGRAFSQAKFTQKMGASYTGSSADTLAATQNAAWVGETATGEAGADMPADAEIVTPLNTAGGSYTGNNPGSYGNFNLAETCVAKCAKGDNSCIKGCLPDQSPWKADASNVLKLILTAGLMATAGAIMIMMGRALTLAGAALIKTGTLWLSNPFTASAGAALIAAGKANIAKGAMYSLIGKSLCISALLMSVAALAQAVHIGTAHKQAGLALIYGLGAALAGTAALAAMFGSVATAVKLPATWFALGAVLLSSIMSVFKGGG